MMSSSAPSTRVGLFIMIVILLKHSYSQIDGFIINSVLLLRVGTMKIEYPHTKWNKIKKRWGFF